MCATILVNERISMYPDVDNGHSKQTASTPIFPLTTRKLIEAITRCNGSPYISQAVGIYRNDDSMCW